MFVARSLREKNMVSYLLYMWQTEELIRAVDFSVERLEELVIKPANRSAGESKAWREWYENIIEMMISEQKREKGHIQINENVLANLSELHAGLLRSGEHEDYRQAYYKALPLIMEYRSKAAHQGQEELRDCFELLFGTLILRLNKKEVSKETLQAVSVITAFLQLLSKYYLEKTIVE